MFSWWKKHQFACVKGIPKAREGTIESHIRLEVTGSRDKELLISSNRSNCSWDPSQGHY